MKYCNEPRSAFRNTCYSRKKGSIFYPRTNVCIYGKFTRPRFSFLESLKSLTEIIQTFIYTTLRVNFFKLIKIKIENQSA